MSLLSKLWGWLTGSGTGIVGGSDVPSGSLLIVEANRVRLQRGLQPLSERADLITSATAQARRCVQAGHLTHAGSIHAEIIAAGQRTAAEAVADWLSDPPHARELLGSYHYAGGAVVRGRDGVLYWCLDFA